MKGKALIPLALGAVVGLVAIKFLVDTVQRAQGKSPETITTFVAKVDVPASIELSAEMLAQVETPKSPLVPEGAFSKAEDLIGRVTSKSIPQGSVISPLSLAPPGTPSGLTERIEEGYRAVSLRIDDVTGVAGQLRPGDFVDVIVVMRVNRGRKAETISRIILQKIKVIAVGQNLASSSEASSEKLARSVTLLVRDVDVPKLHLAQTQGTITLAMRGADDRLIPDTGAGYASTLDWEEPPQDQDTDPRRAVAERVDQGLAAARPVETAKPFAVTIINGPLGRPGSAAVQRVTYENHGSMKVVAIETGRGAHDRASASDSAESIMRQPRRAGPHELDVPSFGRGGQRSGEYQQPPDREIDQE